MKGGGGSVSFNLTNTACPAITVSPATPTLPDGRTGRAYSQTVTQTGGAGTPTFSISAGALPAGLALAAGGLLSGTPTVFGAFNFTVRATDINLCAGERMNSLTVQPPCPAFTINPTALPNGFLGALYNQTLTASGGGSPYNFAVTTGKLPGGVTLASDGALAGTPAAAGIFNFTVTATDTNGCTGSRGYTILVSGSGLLFYPLAHPVRLLDTRVSAAGCFTPNAAIFGGTSRTQSARGTCDGVIIPNEALGGQQCNCGQFERWISDHLAEFFGATDRGHLEFHSGSGLQPALHGGFGRRGRRVQDFHAIHDRSGCGYLRILRAVSSDQHRISPCRRWHHCNVQRTQTVR